MKPNLEPDWSQLPAAAVAWAVDGDGLAWFYRSKPNLGLDSWLDGGCIASDTQYDLTGIDWRTTLRLRPALEAKVEPKPDPHVLADHLPDESHSHLELERIVEKVWKSRICGLVKAEINEVRGGAQRRVDELLAEIDGVRDLSDKRIAMLNNRAKKISQLEQLIIARDRTIDMQQREILQLRGENKQLKQESK